MDQIYCLFKGAKNKKTRIKWHVVWYRPAEENLSCEELSKRGNSEIPGKEIQEPEHGDRRVPFLRTKKGTRERGKKKESSQRVPRGRGTRG